jgi:hypothetical protein
MLVFVYLASSREVNKATTSPIYVVWIAMASSYFYSVVSTYSESIFDSQFTKFLSIQFNKRIYIRRVIVSASSLDFHA